MSSKAKGKACKYARREGRDLFLKRKPLKEKSKKSANPPGQHGKDKAGKKVSTYGTQLRAKQTIKRIYGVAERQFRNYYLKAASKKSATGVVLLQMLESRLDNIVFRCGFGSTRPEARQLVSHGAILVDGHRVNIASFQVKPGSVISIAEKAKAQARIQDSLQLVENQSHADWIETNASEKTATFKRLPLRDELPADYNEHLIVELYSK